MVGAEAKERIRIEEENAMLEITKNLKLSDKMVQMIRDYIEEHPGATWREIFYLLETEIEFSGIEECAVEIVQELIVDEIMERDEFFGIFLVDCNRGGDK